MLAGPCRAGNRFRSVQPPGKGFFTGTVDYEHLVRGWRYSHRPTRDLPATTGPRTTPSWTMYGTSPPHATRQPGQIALAWIWLNIPGSPLSRNATRRAHQGEAGAASVLLSADDIADLNTLTSASLFTATAATPSTWVTSAADHPPCDQRDQTTHTRLLHRGPHFRGLPVALWRCRCGWRRGHVTVSPEVSRSSGPRSTTMTTTGTDRPFSAKQVVRPRDQVEQQLREAILDGHFGQGEKLPPETALAQLFGVSRPTVREALGTLVSAGLIRKIPGVAGGASSTRSPPTR